MKKNLTKNNYVYRFLPLILLIFVSSSWAQWDFEMTVDSTTIEDNADFNFYFEHTSGADYISIFQIVIGENREDPNAIFINVRRGTNFIEIGETGARGRFISGGVIGSETIINGTRFRANLASARLSTIGSNQNHLLLNLSFRNKEFEGLKRIYMDARDAQGQWGGQRQVGTITVEQPDSSASRHKPEIISLDKFNNNAADGSYVRYLLNVKDKDGKQDLRNVVFEMNYKKSRGIFGSSRYSVNFIMLTIDFENGTYTVFDMERGYYRAETKTVGAARVFLNGATVLVESIEPERFEPDVAYAAKLVFTFENRWAGKYELSANASDRSYKYSGKKGLGNLEIEGGTEAPIPTNIAPHDIRMNYEEAPGDRIPVRFSTWWMDDDGADDIKFVDIKFANDSGDKDDIFFLRVYPNDNKKYFSDSELDWDKMDGGSLNYDSSNDLAKLFASELSIEEVTSKIIRIRFPSIPKRGFHGRLEDLHAGYGLRREQNRLAGHGRSDGRL
jgi:hypothetical protein